jgi:hypothetical protein
MSYLFFFKSYFHHCLKFAYYLYKFIGESLFLYFNIALKKFLALF